MNILKNLIVALLFAVTLQAAPLKLPVGSLRAMWQYNVQQLRGGGVQAYNREILGMPGNTNYMPFTYNPKGVVNVTEVNTIIKSTYLSFQSVKPEKGFDAWITIDDSFGRTLFSGGDHVDTTPQKAGSYAPIPKKIKLLIADEIYFPCPGATYARFNEEDSNGNFIREVDVPVQNGWIVWPTGYTTNLREKDDWDNTQEENTDQKFGEVRVTVEDPSGYHEVSFRLDQGGHQDAGDIIQGNGIEAQLGGVIAWQTDNREVRFVVGEEDALFTGQLTYTPSTFTSTVVAIYPAQGKLANGQIVAEANRFTLKDAVTQEVMTKDPLITSWDAPMWIALRPGTYYLEYQEWNNPSFGYNYHEYHDIPSEQVPEPTVVDGGK